MVLQNSFTPHRYHQLLLSAVLGFLCDRILLIASALSLFEHKSSNTTMTIDCQPVTRPAPSTSRVLLHQIKRRYRDCDAAQAHSETKLASQLKQSLQIQLSVLCQQFPIGGHIPNRARACNFCTYNMASQCMISGISSTLRTKRTGRQGSCTAELQNPCGSARRKPDFLLASVTKVLAYKLTGISHNKLGPLSLCSYGTPTKASNCITPVQTTTYHGWSSHCADRLCGIRILK